MIEKAKRALVLLSIPCALWSLGCSQDHTTPPAGWELTHDQDIGDMATDVEPDSDPVDMARTTEIPGDQGLMLEDDDPCRAEGQRGRCAVGYWETMPLPRCVQVYSPMLEVCNSEDDDCDDANDEGGWEPQTNARHQALIEAGVDATKLDELETLVCVASSG